MKKPVCWNCGEFTNPQDPDHCEDSCPHYGECAGGVELREALSVLSSKLGAGLGDESRSMLEYVKGIEWGIDHNTSVMQKMIDDLRAEVFRLESKVKETTIAMHLSTPDGQRRFRRSFQLAAAKAADRYPPGSVIWKVARSLAGLPKRKS